jgi:hypothetical protein
VQAVQAKRRLKECLDTSVDLTKKPSKTVQCMWLRKHWAYIQKHKLNPKVVAGAYKRHYGVQPSLTRRVGHMMDIWAHKAFKEGRRLHVLNISQPVDRSATMTDRFPCITLGGSLWVTSIHRCLTPCEKLLLQNLPMDRLDLGANTPREVEPLAGNAMHTRVSAPNLHQQPLTPPPHTPSLHTRTSTTSPPPAHRQAVGAALVVALGCMDLEKLKAECAKLCAKAAS